MADRVLDRTGPSLLPPLNLALPVLYTNAWTAERFDQALIFKQGTDRLAGRVEGVPHH